METINTPGGEILTGIVTGKLDDGKDWLGQSGGDKSSPQAKVKGAGNTPTAGWGAHKVKGADKR